MIYVDTPSSTFTEQKAKAQDTHIVEICESQCSTIH